MSDYYWEARCHAAETECVKLHEQISFLESREVCAAAHDNVETCGYCQRDEQAKRIEMLEEALRRYGRHDSFDEGDICEWWTKTDDDCTCGLSAALAAGKGDG